MTDNVDLSEIRIRQNLPQPDVDLGPGYKRVREELNRIKQKLSVDVGTIISDQIELDDDIHVRYNPNPARSVPVVETISLKKEYMYLYGEYQYLGGSGTSSMLGLQDFVLDRRGDITVSVFEQNDKKIRNWSARRPASYELFNQALSGLLKQHAELVADFEKRPVVNVTVPQLAGA